MRSPGHQTLRQRLNLRATCSEARNAFGAAFRYIDNRADELKKITCLIAIG
jgi:hypothetical protein